MNIVSKSIRFVQIFVVHHGLVTLHRATLHRARVQHRNLRYPWATNNR